MAHREVASAKKEGEIRPSSPLRAFCILLLVVWSALLVRSVVAMRIDPLLTFPLLGLIATLVLGLSFPRASRALVSALEKVHDPVFVFVCALIAASISYWVVRSPMNARPLSIDGHVYLQQARALSHLHLGMPLPSPRLSFSARFLFEGADGRLHGVFPPGFPLFLAPFVRLSIPLLSGPVIAASLVVAQHDLAHALKLDAWTARLSILLALPSFARAVETADLLSHAFVAVLATFALSSALRLVSPSQSGAPLAGEIELPRSRLRALAVGVCLGWASAARLLDGLVISLVALSILVYGCTRRGLPVRHLLLAVFAMLPFVLLVAADQKAATGSLFTPTQSAYFMRADYPSTCHRLGFGPDVGCAVEHPDEHAFFGAAGYTLRQAARVVSERAGLLGSDLFGLVPMTLLAFVVVAVQNDRRDVLCASIAAIFTLVYGLFYYGNAPMYGARHLFPIAPLFYVLVARAIDLVPPRAPGARFDATHLRASIGLALVVSCIAGQIPRWVVGLTLARHSQRHRVDVRSVMAAHHVTRGIVVTADELSFIAAFDPQGDGDDLIVVPFDGSGLRDLRRFHPTLPMHFVLDGDGYQTSQLAAPPPGILVELERAAPSFERPIDAGVNHVRVPGTSADTVLAVFEAHPGSSLVVPFDVAREGRYALRIDGVVGADHGLWEVRIDEAPLLMWDGYGPTQAVRAGNVAPARFLSAGPHSLSFRCLGRAPASTGYRAAFDTLVGTLATQD